MTLDDYYVDKNSAIKIEVPAVEGVQTFENLSNRRFKFDNYLSEKYKIWTSKEKSFRYRTSMMINNELDTLSSSLYVYQLIIWLCYSYSATITEQKVTTFLSKSAYSGVFQNIFWV